jgi:hypothetical protein
MDKHEQVPASVPGNRPSVARMYDYWLGGFHNFAVDREAAEQVNATSPDMPLVVRANRAFLYRVVRFLASEGIAQFLDLGSGIPTVGNVHEVARAANPAARVVYVDIDPVAVSHSRAILGDNPQAIILQADVRRPEQFLHHPDLSRLLDVRQPVGVLVVAVLHFVGDDEEAYRAVRVLRDAVAPGSYLAITHASTEGFPPEAREQHNRISRSTPTPIKFRSRADIARFFDGFELVEPGLVLTPLWRPHGPDDLFVDQPERSSAYAGVGRKR